MTFQTSSRLHLLTALVVTVTSLPFQSASAQVSIHVNDGEILVENAGYAPQRAIRSVGKNGAGWLIEDGVGNSYQACNTTCSQSSDGTWTCSSWSSADNVDPSLVTGYNDALQYLVDQYGAVVKHDPALDVDHVSFPDADEPYELLATILLNDYLDGRLLLEYFKSLELSSIGFVGAEYVPVKPKGQPLDFPDDPFFTSQWNLPATNLHVAQWHPFTSKLDRPVRLAIIDSGINEKDQGHPGLDGVAELTHRWTALTTGFAAPHALAIASLISDRADDGSGIVGLAGSWANTCGQQSSLFSRHPIELFSYNAGDFGVISYLAAGAIDAAVEEGVDIININFRAAYSPLIEQAVQKALEAGIIVVAAAGNYFTAHPTKPTAFPANLEGVISVQSTGRGGAVSNFSASAATLAAPGEEIYLGGPDATWTSGQGTSFASPHVAVAAALLKMADPDITPAEVAGVLAGTATQRSKNAPAVLDVLAAVNAVLPESERTTSISTPSECTELAKQDDAAAESSLPERPLLHGNYPNPFNPSTTISFSLYSTDAVTFSVFDMLGRRVSTWTRALGSGRHEIDFNGDGLMSGTYFYRLEGSDWRREGRMMLLK